MKKIIITMFIAGASLLTACSDAYDIEQKGFVTREDQIFNTPEDFEIGLRSVYRFFPGEEEIKFVSYFTDELGIGVNNAGQGVNDGTYTFTLRAGNDDLTAIWDRHYGVLNNVNRMKARIDVLIADIEEQIANITNNPTLKDSLEAELESYKEHKAHIHALRAYCHYKLFVYFTPDYSDPNGLSVIKFDFPQTDDYNRFEARATVGEIVKFIEDEIEDAKLLGGVQSQGKGFASNAMLEAILIKLYAAIQTPDAYNKLEEAFNRLTVLGTNSLGNVWEYSGMFSGDGEGDETIFKLNRVPSDDLNNQGVQSGVANAWYANRVEPGLIVYMEMGRSLYNELDKLDPNSQGFPYNAANPRTDARYTVALLEGSIVAPNYASMTTEQFRNEDILYIGKYQGIQNRPLMNEIFIFRYTDMLLALAEKRAFEGNLTGNVALNDYSNVESIIYNIRANRNFEASEPVSMPTNFSSTQQAYARILEERRMEFAYEGHRYLDMKRLGAKADSPGFVRDPQDCATTGACSLEATSTKLTAPIPYSEVMANPNMVQNPGY